MGNCCVCNIKTVSLESTIKAINDRNGNSKLQKKKTPTKSTRSSIYQINDEDISQVYVFSTKIGSGYHGVVKKAFLKSNPTKIFAVKSIEKSKLSIKTLKNLSREIEVLAKLDHPNIIKYYETYNDEKFFHMVMEYCEGGELIDRIDKRKKMSEKECAEILYKLSSAICHCHAKGIVHRDMKAENVLFETKSDTKCDVKIIDFGLARKTYDNNMHSVLGTPCYVAPEVLDGTYDEKCDVWALGVMMYIMLLGRYPFDCEKKPELFKQIKSYDPPIDRNDLSPEAIQLMKALLTKDPMARPDARTEMEHPWYMKQIPDIFIEKMDNELLPTLKSFSKPNPFMKFILKFIIKEIHSEELENFKKTFYSLERNKTGMFDKFETVTLTEGGSHMTTSLQRAGTFQTAGTFQNNQSLSYGGKKNYLTNNFFPIKKKKTITITNNNNNNSNSTSNFDYTSFLAAIIKNKNLFTKEIQKQTFNNLDVDNCGYITLKGFYQAMKRRGKKITEEEVEKMLRDAGLRNVNGITFEEFSEVMEKYIGY